MQLTNDKNKRLEQKILLQALYPDYVAKHHDIFVLRYNRDMEQKTLNDYMKARGLK
jgi:hypothetical protein